MIYHLMLPWEIFLFQWITNPHRITVVPHSIQGTQSCHLPWPYVVGTPYWSHSIFVKKYPRTNVGEDHTAIAPFPLGHISGEKRALSSESNNKRWMKLRLCIRTRRCTCSHSQSQLRWKPTKVASGEQKAHNFTHAGVTYNRETL